MYAPSPRSPKSDLLLLAAAVESLLVELLDESVVKVDGNGGDQGDQRGLVGVVISGEVGESKTRL